MRTVQAAERRLSAVFVLGSLAALLCLWWRPPQALPIPPCPFNALTGLYCPGCGTLRALHSLLHGHLSRAFGFNPLTVLLLPYIALLGLNEAASLLAGRKWTFPASPRLGWALLTVVLAFWVVRNLPFRELDVLRPVPGNPRLQGIAQTRQPGLEVEAWRLSCRS